MSDSACAWKPERAVTSLKIERDRVTGIETSRGFIAADAVVIAGGAWSSC